MFHHVDHGVVLPVITRKTTDQIAKEFGVSRSTIIQRLQTSDIAA